MEILLNELYLNDLFKFVHVRGPIKKRTRVPIDIFTFEPYDSPLKMAKYPDFILVEATLFQPLENLRGTSSQLSDSNTLVINYKSSASFISTPELYEKIYPELTLFANWLDVYADTATPSEVKEKFSEIFNASESDYVLTDEFYFAQFKIWDNLLANLFAANNPLLVTLACKYLGVLNLIDVRGNGYELEHHSEFPGKTYRSKPLLPKWFFEISTSIPQQPEEGINDQTPPSDDSVEILKGKFITIKQAHQSLNKLFANKYKAALEFQKKQDDAFTPDPGVDGGTPYQYEDSSNPLLMTAAELATLNSNVASLITSFFGETETYYIDQILNLVTNEAAKIGSELAKGERVNAIKIGNTIISSEDICADMIEKNPCAQIDPKEFASKGSFMTSALIGDLLVTKQQLIKYDLGEVSNVETAMDGLIKERTHRRLQRTEETFLEEKETTTENERENQTTDRFDMEKETTKIIEQDVSVAAGLNVSGSYGTVNYTASLDASYGYSTLQSQTDATSYSQSVTTRALTRVKERVRTVKTFTIINEVEETSLNKLSNLSGDNVNGVYRWLDKFYLNKIINYGKRLLFEFSIPEPANFYIFRQSIKPQSGHSIEKPKEPSTVLGPDGFYLQSADNITELSYTFYASLYGATGIDAPPQQFKRNAVAYKNSGAASQSGDVVDSFSTNIDILPDYELYFASAIRDLWQSSSPNAVYTYIGGIGIGAAGSSTVSFPFISNTVGLSIISRSQAWICNIVLHLMRSPKAYREWQIATYAKIIQAYEVKKREYEAWLDEQNIGTGLGFNVESNNPGINRQIEQEEIKKRCLEMFTGQRFESFDAAVNGIYNQSGCPEILFAEAIKEGNLVKFFEQAFDWANMTYVFYPYMWGRKNNWLTNKLIEDPSDPLFTKFLQAGYARAVVPARPGFENYLLMFNQLSNLVSSFGCAWNFQPAMFGQLGISNTFRPAVNDPTYISIAEELQQAANYNDVTGPLYGTPYVQKVPTNLVYIAQNSHVANTTWP